MNLDFINYTNLSLEDHQQLLQIRNQEYVLRNMKNSDAIKIADHLSWVSTLGDDKSKLYYAIFSENTLVGGINITDMNHENSTSSWGLFIQNNLNPMIPSLATYLIIDKIFNSLGINKLNLEVNKLNSNAYQFDKNFGFVDNGEYSDDRNTYHLMSMDKDTWQLNKEQGLLKILKSKLTKINYTFQETKEI